jgi:hypothetical protein
VTLPLLARAKLCDAGGNAVGAYTCRCCRPAPSEPRVPPMLFSDCGPKP